MWVKTQDGNLCNIGRAATVDRIDTRIVIYFESGQTVQLANLPSTDDAERFMKGLGLAVSAKSFTLSKPETG